MKDNLTPEEHKYLIETIEQGKEWINKNAPDNVAESFNLMFKLITYQNNAMSNYSKVVKDQSALINKQTEMIAKSGEQVDQMLDVYSSTNKLEKVKNELIGKLTEMKDEVLANGTNSPKGDTKA